MSYTILRPSPSEYAPFYHGYVQSVPEGDVIHYLSEQLSEVEALFGQLPNDRASVRYAPDKWSVKEVLGHLSDVERVMSYRLLRIARGDATPLAGFDQNELVSGADFDRQPLRDLLGDFHAVRASTLTLVRGLDESAWSRTGVVSSVPITARSFAYIMAGHIVHHLRVLRERYDIAGVGTATPPSV